MGGTWDQRGEGIKDGVDQLGAEGKEPEEKAGVGVVEWWSAWARGPGLGWR